MIVRRRSEPVEAVQWHKPGDHPAVQPVHASTEIMGILPQPHTWPREHLSVHAGDWITKDGELGRYRVLTPEQFEAEYERVE